MEDTKEVVSVKLPGKQSLSGSQVRPANLTYVEKASKDSSSEDPGHVLRALLYLYVFLFFFFS